MNKIDVVVIDDDDGILWLMEEILSENYYCKTYRSGLNGLKCIEEDQPQLVILDLKLGGGMNGIDVAKKITEKCNETSIIFLTGYRKTVMDNLDKNLPVIKVIEKPFVVINLMEIINRFFKGNMRLS